MTFVNFLFSSMNDDGIIEQKVIGKAVLNEGESVVKLEGFEDNDGLKKELEGKVGIQELTLADGEKFLAILAETYSGSYLRASEAQSEEG